MLGLGFKDLLSAAGGPLAQARNGNGVAMVPVLALLKSANNEKAHINKYSKADK